MTWVGRKKSATVWLLPQPQKKIRLQRPKKKIHLKKSTLARSSRSTSTPVTGVRARWRKLSARHSKISSGNLTDHLMWQLGALGVRPQVREAAELVIGNLSEDGYLIASDEELLGTAAPASPEADAKTQETLVKEAAALGLGSEEAGTDEGVEPALTATETAEEELNTLSAEAGIISAPDWASFSSTGITSAQMGAAVAAAPSPSISTPEPA